MLAEVEPMVAASLELAEMELRRFNVRLNCNVAGRLPPLLVDRILIEQVLVNLLRNAAESVDAAQRPSPERIVELRVVGGIFEGKKSIEFSVQDSGKGIAADVMPRLYEAFFSTKAEGMGIGLSLCRSIVESHRGRLTAENLYNEGAVSGCRFTFWLPLT
jgi:signal transduction histidine kinase